MTFFSKVRAKLPNFSFEEITTVDFVNHLIINMEGVAAKYVAAQHPVLSLAPFMYGMYLIINGEHMFYNQEPSLYYSLLEGIKSVGAGLSGLTDDGVKRGVLLAAFTNSPFILRTIVTALDSVLPEVENYDLMQNQL